jgi:hypothetical protein
VIALLTTRGVGSSLHMPRGISYQPRRHLPTYLPTHIATGGRRTISCGTVGSKKKEGKPSEASPSPKPASPARALLPLPPLPLDRPFLSFHRRSVGRQAGKASPRTGPIPKHQHRVAASGTTEADSARRVLSLSLFLFTVFLYFAPRGCLAGWRPG